MSVALAKVTAVIEATEETELGAAAVRLVNKALVTLVCAAVAVVVIATKDDAAALVVERLAAVGASECAVNELEAAAGEGDGWVTGLNEKEVIYAVAAAAEVLTLLAVSARFYNGRDVEGTDESDKIAVVVGGETARATAAATVVVVVVVVVVAAVEGAVVLCDEDIGGPEEADRLPEEEYSGYCIGLYLRKKLIILRNKCIYSYINYHLGYC